MTLNEFDYHQENIKQIVSNTETNLDDDKVEELTHTYVDRVDELLFIIEELPTAEQLTYRSEILSLYQEISYNPELNTTTLDIFKQTFSNNIDSWINESANYWTDVATQTISKFPSSDTFVGSLNDVINNNDDQLTLLQTKYDSYLKDLERTIKDGDQSSRQEALSSADDISILIDKIITEPTKTDLLNDISNLDYNLNNYGLIFAPNNSIYSNSIEYTLNISPVTYDAEFLNDKLSKFTSTQSFILSDKYNGVISALAELSRDPSLLTEINTSIEDLNMATTEVVTSIDSNLTQSDTIHIVNNLDFLLNNIISSLSLNVEVNESINLTPSIERSLNQTDDLFNFLEVSYNQNTQLLIDTYDNTKDQDKHTPLDIIDTEFAQLHSKAHDSEQTFLFLKTQGVSLNRALNFYLLGNQEGANRILTDINVRIDEIIEIETNFSVFSNILEYTDMARLNTFVKSPPEITKEKLLSQLESIKSQENFDHITSNLTTDEIVLYITNCLTLYSENQEHLVHGFQHLKSLYLINKSELDSRMSDLIQSSEHANIDLEFCSTDQACTSYMSLKNEIANHNYDLTAVVFQQSMNHSKYIIAQSLITSETYQYKNPQSMTEQIDLLFKMTSVDDLVEFISQNNLDRPANFLELRSAETKLHQAEIELNTSYSTIQDPQVMAGYEAFYMHNELTEEHKDVLLMRFQESITRYKDESTRLKDILITENSRVTMIAQKIKAGIDIDDAERMEYNTYINLVGHYINLQLTINSELNSEKLLYTLDVFDSSFPTNEHSWATNLLEDLGYDTQNIPSLDDAQIPSVVLPILAQEITPYTNRLVSSFEGITQAQGNLSRFNDEMQRYQRDPETYIETTSKTSILLKSGTNKLTGFSNAIGDTRTEISSIISDLQTLLASQESSEFAELYPSFAGQRTMIIKSFIHDLQEMISKPPLDQATQKDILSSADEMRTQYHDVLEQENQNEKNSSGWVTVVLAGCAIVVGVLTVEFGVGVGLIGWGSAALGGSALATGIVTVGAMSVGSTVGLQLGKGITNSTMGTNFDYSASTIASEFGNNLLYSGLAVTGGALLGGGLKAASQSPRALVATAGSIGLKGIDKLRWITSPGESAGLSMATSSFGTRVAVKSASEGIEEGMESLAASSGNSFLTAFAVLLNATNTRGSVNTQVDLLRAYLETDDGLSLRQALNIELNIDGNFTYSQSSPIEFKNQLEQIGLKDENLVVNDDNSVQITIDGQSITFSKDSSNIEPVQELRNMPELIYLENINEFQLINIENLDHIKSNLTSLGYIVNDNGSSLNLELNGQVYTINYNSLGNTLDISQNLPRQPESNTFQSSEPSLINKPLTSNNNDATKPLGSTRTFKERLSITHIDTLNNLTDQEITTNIDDIISYLTENTSNTQFFTEKIQPLILSGDIQINQNISDYIFLSNNHRLFVKILSDSSIDIEHDLKQSIEEKLSLALRVDKQIQLDRTKFNEIVNKVDLNVLESALRNVNNLTQNFNSTEEKDLTSILKNLQIHNPEAYSLINNIENKALLLESGCLNAVIERRSETLHADNNKNMQIFIGKHISQGGIGSVDYVLFQSTDGPRVGAIKRAIYEQPNEWRAPDALGKTGRDGTENPSSRFDTNDRNDVKKSMFEEELKSARLRMENESWQHENIIQTLAIGKNNDFIIYETFNNTMTMKESMNNTSCSQWLTNFQEVTHAVEEVFWNQGFYHGDLKNLNVLIGDGRAVVIDIDQRPFNTYTTQSFGTPLHFFLPNELAAAKIQYTNWAWTDGVFKPPTEYTYDQIYNIETPKIHGAPQSLLNDKTISSPQLNLSPQPKTVPAIFSPYSEPSSPYGNLDIESPNIDLDNPNSLPPHLQFEIKEKEVTRRLAIAQDNRAMGRMLEVFVQKNEMVIMGSLQNNSADLAILDSAKATIQKATNPMHASQPEFIYELRTAAQNLEGIFSKHENLDTPALSEKQTTNDTLNVSGLLYTPANNSSGVHTFDFNEMLSDSYTTNSQTLNSQLPIIPSYIINAGTPTTPNLSYTPVYNYWWNFQLPEFEDELPPSLSYQPLFQQLPFKDDQNTGTDGN